MRRIRQEELGVSLAIRDDKTKVTQQGGILVGEVSETQDGLTRKRRLCATAGRYTLAEGTGPDTRVTGTGTASNFVVLGNEVTKQVAHACIREHWKGGSIHDAVRVLVLIMERASGATASVSGRYTLVQTRSSPVFPMLPGRTAGVRGNRPFVLGTGREQAASGRYRFTGAAECCGELRVAGGG